MPEKVKGFLAAAISAIAFGFIPMFAVPLMKDSGKSVDSVLFYRFFFASLVIGI